MNLVERKILSPKLEQNVGTNIKKIGEQLTNTHDERNLQEYPLNEGSSATFLENNHKRGCEKLQGELRKIKPPMFYDEKNVKEVEMWFLYIRRYLQLHHYAHNLKSKIVIYNLQGKTSMW